MQAYVLCGGFGMRLRSVTDAQKAMVQVHGEPFLAVLLRQLALSGVTQVVLCAHYRAEQVAESLPLLTAQTGLELKMVREEQPLGTGGALLNALRLEPAKSRYLLLNADTYVEAHGYRAMIDSQGDALLGVQVEDRQRYGSLQLNAAGELVALLEKGASGPGLINGGVYAFSASTFADVPVHACSLERDLLPQLLAQRSVRVVAYSGRFIDIGTPESLEHFRNEFAREANR